MNSKEKAKELVARYMILFSNQEQYLEEAKQCALIAMDELLNHCYEVMKPFWEEVKLEIEKL
jgi:hypothetical protein